MNIWLTIYRAATTVFIALFVIGLLGLFLPQIRENRAKQREVARLEEENRVRDEMIQRLKMQQEHFETDPRFVERIAREELGKAKPGEIIFRFTETNSAGRRTAPR